MLYVIGEKRTGVVKIGYAMNPVSRLRAIQAGNPRPLQLLVSLPGERDDEAVLHQCFADRCTGGEWFDFGSVDAVLAVAEAVGSAPELPDRAVASACRQLTGFSVDSQVYVPTGGPSAVLRRKPSSAVSDDLTTAAQRWALARDEERATRDALRLAVIAAHADGEGLGPSELERRSGATRQTVLDWLGKRRRYPRVERRSASPATRETA